MPVTIKSSVFQYKNTNGEYVGVDAIADKTTAEQVAQVNSAISAKITEMASATATNISAIETKGQQTIASIPSDYTELSEDVENLKSDLSELQYFVNDGEYTIVVSDLESGYWGYSTKMNNSKRLRNKQLIPVKAGMIVYTQNPTMKIYIGVLESLTASTYRQTTGWKNAGENVNVVIDYNGYMTLMFESTTDITPSDYDSTIAIKTSESIDLSDACEKINNMSDVFESMFDENINIPSSDVTDGYVIANTGGLGSSSNWKDTYYLDVRRFKALVYKRSTSTISAESASAIVGMAFYSDKLLTSYISGELIRYGAKNNSQENRLIIVPNGANYARFTIRSNETISVAGWYKDEYKEQNLNETITSIANETSKTYDEMLLTALSEKILLNDDKIAQGRYINATTGVMTNSSVWNATHFINISGCKTLYYARAKSTISEESEYAIAGMAFYSGMDYSSYISGQKLLYGSNESGVQNTLINVPENAKYVRFTINSTETAETFVLYGILDEMPYFRQIEKIAENTVTNLTPYNELPSDDGLFTPIGDGKYLVNGTNSGQSESIYRIFQKYDVLPNGMKPGRVYKLRFVTDKKTTNLGIRVGYYINQSSTRHGIGQTNSSMRNEFNFVLPDDATGLQIYLYVSANTTISNITANILIEDYTKDRLEMDSVKMYVNGLLTAKTSITYTNQIASDMTFKTDDRASIIIPITSEKTIEVIGKENGETAMVFLRELPQSEHAVKCTYLRDNEGDIVYENNEPVEDARRYVIEKKRAYLFDIPEECKYIYFHSDLPASLNYFIPTYMAFDKKAVLDQRTPEETVEKTSMYTVFFDDFDGNELSDKWTKVRCSPNVMQTHNSMYYTDDDDCWVSNSCLVLKVCEDPNMNLGGSYQYDPETGHIVVDGQGDPILAPRRFKSGYVSSHYSFAMKRGAISARIKLGQPIESSFAWTFFTFSQNNVWPIAPEFDIIEGTIGPITVPWTTKDGTVYPIGTLRPTVASHTHYQKTNDTEGVIDGASKYCANENVLFRKWGTFDETEWNIYKVMWDEEKIEYYINDKLLNRIDLTSESFDSKSIFTSPADIRFNVKSRPWSTGDEAFMYIDWVKAESFDELQPPVGITHEDVTIEVGEFYYVSPTILPETAQNQVFSLTVDHPEIVNLYEKYENYDIMLHRLKGLAAGMATVTMTTGDGHATGTFTVTVV